MKSDKNQEKEREDIENEIDFYHIMLEAIKFGLQIRLLKNISGCLKQ